MILRKHYFTSIRIYVNRRFVTEVTKNMMGGILLATLRLVSQLPTFLHNIAAELVYKHICMYPSLIRL